MNENASLLTRIAEALERLSPAPHSLPDAASAEVFAWQGHSETLYPVTNPRRIPFDFILGVDSQKERLLQNTLRFAAGHPANHAMLWGARGTGKSALVKAVHGDVSHQHQGLKLIEIGRNDIGSVPQLARALAKDDWRAILFIDDLSFERGDDSYKALKSVLDGSVSGDLGNLLVYITSNRRHLVNRPDGTQADFRPDETVEEQMALSERFGLWLGFHPMDQALWLAIMRRYANALDLAPDDPTLDRTALQWAASRGARSGRSAWQFIVERAGDLGKSVDLI
jgi:uncharacterized protein